MNLNLKIYGYSARVQIHASSNYCGYIARGWIQEHRYTVDHLIVNVLKNTNEF